MKEKFAWLADELDGKKILLLQAIGGGFQIFWMFHTNTVDPMNVVSLAINALTAAARLFSSKPGPLAP